MYEEINTANMIEINLILFTKMNNSKFSVVLYYIKKKSLKKGLFIILKMNIYNQLVEQKFPLLFSEKPNVVSLNKNLPCR